MRSIAPVARGDHAFEARLLRRRTPRAARAPPPGPSRRSRPRSRRRRRPRPPAARPAPRSPPRGSPPPSHGFSVRGAIARRCSRLGGLELRVAQRRLGRQRLVRAAQRVRPRAIPCPSPASRARSTADSITARSASSSSAVTSPSSAAGVASPPKHRTTTASASASRSFAMPCALEVPPGTSTKRTCAATVFRARSISVRTWSRGSGTGDDGLVRLAAGRAGTCERREQRGLPAERQSDEADVLHGGRLSAVRSPTWPFGPCAVSCVRPIPRPQDRWPGRTPRGSSRPSGSEPREGQTCTEDARSAPRSACWRRS